MLAGRPLLHSDEGLVLRELNRLARAECDERAVDLHLEIRESVRVEDFTVSFINLENLIKNKQATGRSKDKVDVEFLSENLESEQDSDRSLED